MLLSPWQILNLLKHRHRFYNQIKKVDDIIDDNIGDLSEKTADLKKKIDVENGTSVAKFNKSYQELDKMCNTADYFSDMTDPFLTASKEFKNVTSFFY